MKNFKKGGFQKKSDSFGGRPKFSGVKKFGGKFGGGRNGDDRPPQRMDLFPAVCSKCGKNCKVPFRPSGDKPVYCRDCFDRQEQVPGRNSNGMDRPVGPRRDFRADTRPPRDNEYQYKPVPVRAQREDGVDGLRRQLVVLESKVDRILELVSGKNE